MNEKILISILWVGIAAIVLAFAMRRTHPQVSQAPTVGDTIVGSSALPSPSGPAGLVANQTWSWPAPLSTLFNPTVAQSPTPNAIPETACAGGC